MRNEDKILAMLEQLQQGQTSMQAELEQLQQGQASMQADIQDLKTDMSEVKARVTKIEITQENTILPQMRLLYEGHSGLAETLKPLKALPDQVEDIQNTVSVLKYVFKAHTHD